MKSTWFRCLVLSAAAISLAGCDAFISTQTRIERARADLDAGRWGSASIELQRAVRKTPDNPQVWLLLARLSLDAADARDAPGDLSHAVKAGAKGRALDELRVRAWLATNQAKALLVAASHHELDLPEPDLSIAVARAHNELGQPQQALSLLEPILAAHPALTAAHVAAAEALAREGKFDAALEQTDTAMRHEPKSAQAPLMKARLLELRGEFGDAESAYLLALKRMSPGTSLEQRAMALAGLTEARLAQGKVELASKSEAVLAKIVPSAPATQLLQARLELAHGNNVSAISDLQRLVEAAPTDVEARLILAAAQLAHNSLQQAQQNLEQVVRQTPDNVEARKLLARVRLKLDQPDEALQVLTPALGERKIDPQLYALFGAAAKRSSNPGAALSGLQDAVHAHPKDTTLRLNLAQAELVSNQARDALSLLEATPATEGADQARRDGLLILALNAVKGPVAASAAVQKMVRERPHDARLLDIAASYYASQGDLDRARSLLKQALAIAPHDRSTQLGLARVDLAAGDASASAALLRSVLKADPKNAAVRIALSDVLTRERAFAEAERVLEASESAHAGPEVPLALARVYLASGHLKKASAALDRATALDPRNATVSNDAGTLLMQANQYDAALARFHKATKLAPGNAQYWLDSGKAQLALNQPLAARESFEKALKIEPQWLPAVTGLTLIDLRSKDFSSALSRTHQYLASHPGDPAALTLEGEVDAAGGRLADAEKAFEDAQKRRPEPAVAVRLYRLREAEHLSNPQEPLEKWLALRPGDTTVRTILGGYYLDRHAWHKAAGELETVVKHAPSNVIAVNNLAWAYAQLHDPRALAMAERAYTLAPHATNVLDTLAWVLARHNQIRRALPLISQAAKARSTDPDIQYHYAYILEKAGHRAEARKVLAKVLADKRPFDSRPDAKRLLAKLKV